MISIRGIFVTFSVIFLLAALGAAPMRTEQVAMHPSLATMKAQRAVVLALMAIALAILALGFRK